jgi:hypothetical protein
MAATQQFSPESTSTGHLSPYQNHHYAHQYNYYQQQQQQLQQNYHPINSYQGEHNANAHNGQNQQQRPAPPSLDSYNYSQSISSYGHNNNCSGFNGTGQNGHHYWNQFYGQTLPHHQHQQQQQQQQPLQQQSNAQSHHHNYGHQNGASSQNQTNRDGHYDNRLFSAAGESLPGGHMAYEANAALMEHHWKQLEAMRLMNEERRKPTEDSTRKSKRKLEDGEASDSPALRALLTNPTKKLKYSPFYFYPGYANLSPVSSTEAPKSITDRQVPDNNPLSPNKTDDSIDFLEFETKQTKTYKDGYETNPPSVDDRMTQPIHEKSPMHHLVEAIATPPLSPPTNQHQNAVYGEKYAASSPSVGSDWQQNEDAGKIKSDTLSVGYFETKFPVSSIFR